MMKVDGSFSDASNSLFDGDYRFEVVHSQNVGTLVFSGHGHSGLTQVYISGGMSCQNVHSITQNMAGGVTHYTSCYTVENRQNRSDYSRFFILWPVLKPVF